MGLEIVLRDRAAHRKRQAAYMKKRRAKGGVI
jgi:hypothetical protein